MHLESRRHCSVSAEVACITWKMEVIPLSTFNSIYESMSV